MPDLLAAVIRERVSAEIIARSAEIKTDLRQPLDQALDSLESLLDEFKSAAFGAPNWDVRALSIAVVPEAGRIEALSIELGLAEDAPDDAAIALLDGNVNLGNLVLSWNLQFDPVDGGLAETRLELDGRLDFKGKFTTDARLSIPALDGSIRLECEPQFGLAEIGELASLVGAGDLAKGLPDGLDGLARLELSYLRFDLEAGFAGLRSVSVALRCSEDWQLIEQRVALQNLRINLILPISGEDAISGYVLGTLALGPVDVDVAVTRFGTTDDWRLAVQSRQIPLPSLQDLSDLTGVDLGALLPQAMLDVSLTIYDLDIDLDLSQRRIERAGFSLAADGAIDLAPGLPAIEGFRVDMLLDWSSGKLAQYGALAGAIALPDSLLNLRGELADEMDLSGSLASLPLSELIAQMLSQLQIPADLPEILLTDIEFSLAYRRATGEAAPAWNFSFASTVRCDLTMLAAALGIPAPQSLGAIELERVKLWRDAADESWHLRLQRETALPFDPDHPDGIGIGPASIELVQASTGTSVDCAFVLDGSAAVSAEVSIGFEQLTFAWQQSEGKWSVEGTVAATIAGQSYPLEAAIEVRGDGHSIALKYPAELRLSDLGGAGSVSLRELALFTEQAGEGEQTTNRWGVSGGAAIVVDHLLEVDGELSIVTGSEGSRLQVTAKAPALPPIGLPLGLPKSPQLKLSLDDLEIAYARDADGESGWSLASAARMQMLDIPVLLQKFLPTEELEGYLRADGETVVIGFDVPEKLRPEFPELALKFSNDVTLSLGKPEIAVTAIELELGEQPRLAQKINVGLPAALNRIFGVDADGRPNLDLFNERFELQLSLAKKLALTVASSPLKPLAFYRIDGDDGWWTKWNFGDVGTIEFRVPEFSYQGDRWSASCGFHRLTEIALPLAPLKFVLEKSGFPDELNAAIPGSLPLREVELTGASFGPEMKRLLGDEVLGHNKQAAAVLDKFLDAVAGVLERLPDHLQEYLHLKVPESAVLEISVDSTGGGSSLALRTLPGDDPLRLMFPMMLGLPELVGVSLRGLSVGQKLGGALALIEFDGQVDRIDLASLIAAMALGRKDLSNRYILDKTLIVLPTALPLPIPLFFTNLGLDYRDILGFEIQAHWSFPDPELGIVETITLFGDLLHFFRDRDYLLHEKGFGETLNLELTIGENFISLPKYLGGQVLGLEKALPTLSVGDSIARFLDFLKTGNAGYAITAIPLQHDGTWIRIGSEQINFGPLMIGMSWCITTDEEFVDAIIPAAQQNDKLPLKFDHAVLDSLPEREAGGAYSKGFIILLMGETALGAIAGLRTEFGIAVTAQGGFETGFRLTGEIGNALRLQMSGAIQAADEAVTVKGDTGLYWKEHTIIASSGHITVSNDSLEVEIKIELGDNFSVEGLFVAGAKGLLLSGKAAWGHGAAGPSEDIGVTVAFGGDGMTMTFDWKLHELDGKVRIRVPGDGGTSLFTATVALEPNQAMQRALITDIKSAAQSATRNTVDQVYDDIEKLAGETRNLELSIEKLRDWLPKLCDEIVGIINRSIDANTTGWKSPGRGPAHRQAKPYIDRLRRLADVARHASTADFRTRLKAALQDIVNHNRLTVTVGVPAVRWKKKWGVPYPVYYTRQVPVYSRDLMNADQLGKLKQAIDRVDQLREKDGLTVKTQDILNNLPPRDKLLAEINRQIDKGVADAAPVIESIGFQTSLGKLETGSLPVVVTYRRAGKLRDVKVTIDLTDPARTASQVIGAIATA